MGAGVVGGVSGGGKGVWKSGGAGGRVGGELGGWRVCKIGRQCFLLERRKRQGKSVLHKRLVATKQGVPKLLRWPLYDANHVHPEELR